MKKKIITVQKPTFSEACPICKHIVKGNSEAQVRYNLNFHKERKHGKVKA